MIVSGAALVVASPILGLAAFAIVVEDRRPVLFHQNRVGRFGKPFQLLKLRSMRVNEVPPERMGQVRGDHRFVTRVGAVIRRLKIDELPQLVNVLRGDMTLIGPRPTIAAQVDRYDAWQRRRLEARPGLSGWAQVNGNIELTWEERIALDVWYVDHWSPWLDLKILAKTLAVISEGENRNEAAVAEGIAYAERSRRRG